MEVIASEWKPISTFCTWILNEVRSDSVKLDLSLKKILSSFDVKICAPEINLRTGSGSKLTLAKLAVNKTHSKSSPMRQRNSSTNGLFSTYTWWITLSISTGTMKSALLIGCKKITWMISSFRFVQTCK